MTDAGVRVAVRVRTVEASSINEAWHERGRLGRNAVSERSIVFVLRAPKVSTEAVVAAAQAIRQAHPCTPTLDVQLRVVSCPPPKSGRSLRFAAEAAAEAAAASLGSRPWVGLLDTMLPLDDAAIQAERWIDVASKLVSPRVIEASDDAFLRRLLRDGAWAAELASVLEPLAEYDRRKKTEVMRTLDAAFLNEPTFQAVAETLCMDRHTVTRHFDRAVKILGRDIRWGIDRLLVEQALLARRALALRSPRGAGGRGVEPTEITSRL